MSNWLMNDRAGLFRPGWIAPVECTGRRAELQGKGEGADNHPSCSQGPHDKTVVARCAQRRPQPATSL